MIDKDPTNYPLLTYGWVIFLSMWGGVVSFYRKMQNGKARPFNIMELLGEIFTSAFTGIITFLLCEASEITPLITAALVGISGHMGSRAIALIEHYGESKLRAIFPPEKHDG
jgi:hypothetical protein